MLKFSVNQAKSFFFDREVVKAIDAQARRALSKFGAFVRTSARSLIRRRKRPSRPGQSPTNQTGILKRFLFFAYDPARRSVVIGPAATNQVFFNGDGKPVRGTVPGVLEYGGEITIQEVQNPFTGRWGRQDLRFRRTDGGGQASWNSRRRRVRIDARPYMQPALEKNRQHLPRLLKRAA